jgi:hypothetical protein
MLRPDPQVVAEAFVLTGADVLFALSIGIEDGSY